MLTDSVIELFFIEQNNLTLANPQHLTALPLILANR